MKRSTAWFKGNVSQGVMVQGKSILTMSATSRSSYSVGKNEPKTPKRFVAGESQVGGEEVVGI
jgi:hypothetical protein